MAVFSPCKEYRYLLEIIWDASLPLCQFIGLNPSTADEFKDDPTVRRCKDFAKRWKCGGLLMTNIFAYRATDPRVMMQHSQPLECRTISNDNELLHAYSRSKIHVAAWGVYGSHMDRAAAVIKALPPLQCLGKTQDGHPKHPLYVPAITELIDL